MSGRFWLTAPSKQFCSYLIRVIQQFGIYHFCCLVAYSVIGYIILQHNFVKFCILARKGKKMGYHLFTTFLFSMYKCITDINIQIRISYNDLSYTIFLANVYNLDEQISTFRCSLQNGCASQMSRATLKRLV